MSNHNDNGNQDRDRALVARRTSLEKTVPGLPVPAVPAAADSLHDGTASPDARAPEARPDTPTLANIPAVRDEVAGFVAGEARLPRDLPPIHVPARAPRRARSDRIARILRAIREEDLDGPLPDDPRPDGPSPVGPTDDPLPPRSAAA